MACEALPGLILRPPFHGGTGLGGLSRRRTAHEECRHAAFAKAQLLQGKKANAEKG